MSKKGFKRIMEKRVTEFRKWCNENGPRFKTRAEIEREKATRERELRDDGRGNHRRKSQRRR